jgi:hypothetical protein
VTVGSKGAGVGGIAGTSRAAGSESVGVGVTKVTTITGVETAETLFPPVSVLELNKTESVTVNAK